MTILSIFEEVMIIAILFKNSTYVSLAIYLVIITKMHIHLLHFL